MAALGQALREEREARNISLEEIASATKIVPRYLEALEADHLDQMPGGFFVKGIIRSYAQRHRSRRGRGPGPVQGRRACRRKGPRPAPAEQVPQYVPTVPIEPESPAETAPAHAPAHEAVTDLFVEEAPKPGLSAASRKRIFAWGWRTLAALVVIARRLLSVVVPAPEAASAAARDRRRPGNASPGSKDGARARAGFAIPDGEPVRARRQAPLSENRASARRRGGLERCHDRNLVPGRDLDPGPHRRRDQGRRPLPRRGHGPGPGRQGADHPHRQRRRLQLPPERPPAKPLGRSGQVLTDIKIRPDNLSEFLEVPASAPSAR